MKLMEDTNPSRILNQKDITRYSREEFLEIRDRPNKLAIFSSFPMELDKHGLKKESVAINNNGIYQNFVVNLYLTHKVIYNTKILNPSQKTVILFVQLTVRLVF